MDDQEQGEKLKRELDRLGLQNLERGDARNRARILGVSPGLLGHWTEGRKRVPNWIWHFLKLWEFAGPGARENLREWAKDQK